MRLLTNSAKCIDQTNLEEKQEIKASYPGGKTPLLFHLNLRVFSETLQILAVSRGGGGFVTRGGEGEKGLQGIAVSLRTAPQRLRKDHRNIKGGLKAYFSFFIGLHSPANIPNKVHGPPLR